MRIPDIEKQTSFNRTSAGLLVPLLAVLLAALVAAVLVLACVPPVSRDALVHHLAIPKLYIKHGGMYKIPSMVFSYYPMNLDLLYLIPLYFHNDIVPKYIHFGFSLLTAGLIFGYLRRRINFHYALLGALLFLSTPVIVNLSISAYVDLGLVFFSAASLFLLVRWMNSGFPPRLLILSAVFCGLGAGTKYNGLITLFLLGSFASFIFARYAPLKNPSFLRIASKGTIFFFTALLVFSPWMIRNYLWTGNPIYPLHDQFFNPQNPAYQSSLSLFTYRSYAYHESWWEMALLPLRIFFQGEDGNPKYFDGKLNPFLLILPFFAFWRTGNQLKNAKQDKTIFLAFAILFFLFALFSTDLRMRYICPIIPPLIILSVFGVKKLSGIVGILGSRGHAGISKLVVFLVLFPCLFLNTKYVVSQFRTVKALDYLKGKYTRDQYIEMYRPEYAAMKFVNENLPADAKILFIHMGDRGYYCDREYVLDMKGAKSTLQQLVRGSQDSGALLRGLRSMGITHLLIHSSIFDRWEKESFSVGELELIEGFFTRHARLLYAKHGYVLFLVSNTPVQ